MKGVGKNLQDHLEIYVQQVNIMHLKKALFAIYISEMHKTHHPLQQIDLAPSAQYDPSWGPMVFDEEGIGRIQPFGIRRICSFRNRCNKIN